MPTEVILKEKRLEIATFILNGMISSTPIVDRTEVDKDIWSKIAVEWADKLIKANNNYTGY